jgi:hypothetical protein
VACRIVGTATMANVTGTVILATTTAGVLRPVITASANVTGTVILATTTAGMLRSVITASANVTGTVILATTTAGLFDWRDVGVQTLGRRENQGKAINGGRIGPGCGLRSGGKNCDSGSGCTYDIGFHIVFLWVDVALVRRRQKGTDRSKGELN